MTLRLLSTLTILWLLSDIRGGYAKPKKDAASLRLLVSYGKACDEHNAAARVLNTLLTSRPRNPRPVNIKHEETVLEDEHVSDYSAYSKRVFSFKTVQFQEASGVPKEAGQQAASGTVGENDGDAQRISRCNISQTTLKLVGLSVVSLEACPSVETEQLREAFQQDECVNSVELDSFVRADALQDTTTITQPTDEEEDEEDEEKKKDEKPSVDPWYWQNLIHLEQSRALGMCSRKIVVGVIDSGIAYDHPALEPNMWTNPHEIPGNNIDDDGNGYVDDFYGYNFIDENSDPIDDLGHGTHVAGIIGAVPGNGKGRGFCNEVSLAALRFMDKEGTGTISVAIEALNYAVLMGFPISCNSWGGPNFSFLLRQAIAQAAKSEHLFVTAAGNKGLPTDILPEFPAALNLPNIITVAASDHDDKLARFSNFGTRTVHLTAPGVNICSTYPPKTFVRLSGTSMATPIVAAVSAMLLSVEKQPLEKVRNAIFTSVDKVPQLKNRVKTGGRVNALKALNVYLEREDPSEEEGKEKEEKERKEKEEKERQETEEEERKAKEEQERKEKEEKEKQDKEQTEKQENEEKAEKEKKAREKQERDSEKEEDGQQRTDEEIEEKNEQGGGETEEGENAEKEEQKGKETGDQKENPPRNGWEKKNPLPDFKWFDSLFSASIKRSLTENI
ncbi:hypothetical protein Esti_004398 [Eimeria stiedai]